MSRRVVTLTERRKRLARLPRDEANFLLVHARHVLDVAPTFDRGTYQLRPRNYVGYFDSPGTRYEIKPKIPWPNLMMLLGLSREAKGEAVEPAGGLLAGLAEEFASRLDAVVRAGLVAGYGEVKSTSPFLKGKLRTADQIRDAAAGAFPDRFHVDEPVFDLHTPWNRVPKAAATALLTRLELPPETRKRVEWAARAFSALPDEAATEADFAAAYAEPRAAGYAPLLDVCRIILQGLASADPTRTEAGAFLVNLERAFERYLIASLRRVLARKPGWGVGSHEPFVLGPTELRPDLVVRRDGSPWAVLDAKWKAVACEPADLHQILAYRTLTGAGRVALVYPGRTDGRAHYFTPDGRVRVSLYRLRVVGTAEQLERSVRRLARSVREK